MTAAAEAVAWLGVVALLSAYRTVAALPVSVNVSRAANITSTQASHSAQQRKMIGCALALVGGTLEQQRSTELADKLAVREAACSSVCESEGVQAFGSDAYRLYCTNDVGADPSIGKGCYFLVVVQLFEKCTGL
eukprot:SAG31_NODE_1660_length_7599_cov_3.194800_7_plen_134_part_00